MGHQVISAEPADAGTLAQVIADAFHDLPQARWLITDPAERAQVFPPYFRIFTDHALAAGTVHTVPGHTAVALWLPVSAGGPAPPGQDYDARLAQATGPHAARFRAFDACLDAHHPAGAAHHHLAMLAVHPHAQGHGIGTALLAAGHAALDQAGTPAYLEASAPRTCTLYQRHGYRPAGPPFTLPHDGPPFWPLWRAATSR